MKSFAAQKFDTNLFRFEEGGGANFTRVFMNLTLRRPERGGQDRLSALSFTSGWKQTAEDA